MLDYRLMGCDGKNGTERISYEFTPLDKLNFRIPAVQRGLVWSPKQVIDLWDSLSKGYPIGSFLAYREGDTQNMAPCLLDGQQRYNAICMGIKPPEDKQKSHAHLWARLCNGKLAFMVCTSCHPWGFRNHGDHITPLEHEEQEQANNTFLNRKGKPLSLQELFCKADLEMGYPWLESSCFVPMYLLFTHTRADKLIEAWKRRGYDETRHCPKDGVKDLLDFIDTSGLRKVQVPVITWTLPPEQAHQENLEELFTRINKGGTQLSSVDQSYSSLCAYCGEELKNLNEELAGQHGGFLPPERLASLAAGLVETEHEKRWVPSVTANNIRKWFRREGEYQGKGERLHELYLSGTLEKTILRFLELCRTAEIPSPIYLTQRDNWLFTMLWVMMRFPRAFERGVPPKLFALFCMLPPMMVGSNTNAAFSAFCIRFHEALRDIPEEATFREPALLSLMALGCANAALEPKCCLHAFPSPASTASGEAWEEQLVSPSSSTAATEGRWVEVFTKYQGTTPNPLLYFYQRRYMEMMLKQSHFNPGMRAHWETPSNRPWDIDHIIPHSWWNVAQDTCNLRNNIGNMQVLDFSRNRSKKNLSARTQNDTWLKEVEEVCLRATEDGMTARLEPEEWPPSRVNEAPSQCGVTGRRNHIIKTLARELPLQELICAINGLGEEEAEIPRLSSSHPLLLSRKRFHFLKQVQAGLEGSGHEVQWAMNSYRWRQKRQNLDPEYCTLIGEPPCRNIDFYHSLVPWLHVGIPLRPEGERALHFLCIGVQADMWCEYGLMRGLDVTPTEWAHYYKEHPRPGTTISSWWAGMHGSGHLDTTTPQAITDELLQHLHAYPDSP